MAINLDASRAASAAPMRIDRQDSDARQHRWMFEMDKAMFASGVKPDTSQAHGEADPAPRTPHVDSEMAPTRALATSTVARLPAMHAQRAGRTDESPAPAAASPLHGLVAAPATSHAPAQAQAQAPAQVESQARASTPVGRAAHGGASKQAMVASVKAGVALAHAAAAPGALAMPFGAHGVSSLAGSPGASAGAVATTPNAPAAALVERAFVALAAAATEAAQQDVTGSESEAAQAAPQPGEAPTFEERLLHVYLANDGVHAYIRDASLHSGQLQAVAQALAAELAGNGPKLAAITINGKAVDARTALPGRDDDVYSPPGDGHDAAPPFLYSSMPVRKGNT